MCNVLMKVKDKGISLKVTTITIRILHKTIETGKKSVHSSPLFINLLISFFIGVCSGLLIFDSENKKRFLLIKMALYIQQLNTIMIYCCN